VNTLIGKNLDRYHIIRLLGEGGMGAVFKARDLTLQRDVAVKVMHPQLARQPNFRKRFLQEARSAARLDHPGIVRVLDFGEADSHLYIVMEFIPGDTLRQKLQSIRAAQDSGTSMGSISLQEALQLVRQICLALDYAHQQGVFHRDIKPDNIILKPDPGTSLPCRPVLTDLGLAKLAEGGLASMEGLSLGTPAYMSPEQALGEETDERSDVYSLGILLYELTVGQLPFPAKSISQAIRYHTQEPLPLPSTVRPDLPVFLEQLILKALAKDPADRFPSAGALAEALATCRQEAYEATGEATVPEAAGDAVTQYQMNPATPARPAIADWFPGIERDPPRAPIQNAIGPKTAISAVSQQKELLMDPPTQMLAGSGHADLTAPREMTEILPLARMSSRSAQLVGSRHTADSRRLCELSDHKNHSSTRPVHPPSARVQVHSNEVAHRRGIPIWILAVVAALLVVPILLLCLPFVKAPAVHSIAVVPPQPHAGQPVTIRWRIDHAQRVELGPFVKLDAARANEHTFPEGFDGPVHLTLVASNWFGRVSKSIDIPVMVPAPTPVPKTTVTPVPSPTVTVTETPTATPISPIRVVLIGQSVQGAPIEVTQIGSGEYHIVLVGGLHAGFAPSTSHLARNAVSHFSSHPELVPANVTLHIIANANPDSPYAPGKKAGRLNARGVDLNRNWDCHWKPKAEWRGKPISGGSAPFSEPESQALHDYLLDVRPVGVVFWEAKVAGGMASPGGCDIPSVASETLAKVYASAAGYQAGSFDSYVLNGDATNWLDAQGIPAISVLLPSYTSTDWNNNLEGILAVAHSCSR
jgi:serine/threonine protein kinase